MTGDERRLRDELPEFLELLGEVSGWVGGLDLAKADLVPPETLAGLRDGLVRALEFLHELFAFRGEPPPAPEPGVAFGSLGPSLKRTLPQRLAAQLEDELNLIGGTRLEDLSQFAALGLFARITDLLRFVSWLEEERSARARAAAPPSVATARNRRHRPAATPPSAPGAAPIAPPSPTGAGPDLSSYDIRIDETGERLDACRAAVWFAAAPGPRAAGEGLAAAFAVPFPGGAALAVAEGVESSLGARLAAVVAVRTFCRALAASPGGADGGLRTAQGHLDMLLSALLSAADASPAFAKVRGAVPPANARRILAHTRAPEEALRRVPPALSAGLVGAIVLEGEGGLSARLLRLGPLLAEVRSGGRTVPLFGGGGVAPPPVLSPGPLGVAALARMETSDAVRLAPGDALLLATAAVAKGSTDAFPGLASLGSPFPEGLSSGDSARDLLRKAERWGIAEPANFAGPLGFAVLLAR